MGSASSVAQAVLLKRFAKDNGMEIKTLPEQFDIYADTNYGGGEHDVWYDGSSNRWIKTTSTAGAVWGNTPRITETGEWRLDGSQSPEQYLQRLNDFNELFGDDVRLHGFVTKDKEIKPLISQPHVEGDTVTQIEITESMAKRAFKNMGHGSYYRASEDNFRGSEYQPLRAVVIL